MDNSKFFKIRIRFFLLTVLMFCTMFSFCSCNQDIENPTSKQVQSGGIDEKSKKKETKNVVIKTDDDGHKRKKNEMDVFCSADDGNAKQTCVTVASLLKNTEEDKEIILNIVHFNGECMSNKNKENFESLKSIRDFKLNFIAFDGSVLDEFDSGSWHKSILIKLFAGEIFKNLDKILWIDDDLVIKDDLSCLWDFDLKGKYLAAVNPAYYYKKYRDYKTPPNPTDYWITAGIGFYNLEEIRKDNILDKFLEFSREFSKNSGVMKGEDILGGIEEYALTKAIPEDKFLSLPQTFSIMAYMAAYGQNPKGFLKEAQEDLSEARVIHFAGPFGKPWVRSNRKNIYYGFLEEWKKYFKMTRFYTEGS